MSGQRGHVRKRGAGWAAYYFVTCPGGQEHRKGERCERPHRWQRSKAGFETKKAALGFLNTVLGDITSGRYTEPSQMTLAAYLTERWMPTLGNLRPSTQKSYIDTANNWIVPRLGHRKLAEITPQMVSLFFNELRDAPRRDGRGTISNRTAQYIGIVLSKALKDAVANGFIPRNPAQHVQRVEGKAPEMSCWSPDQARRFLDGVADDRLATLYLLAVTRGPRRGELLGLRWQDIDLEAGRFSIRQTIVSVGYTLTFSTPKTKKSTRTVPLDAALVGALRKHRTQQLQDRLAAGEAWTDQYDLVFCREDGSPIHPMSLSTAFERHVKRLGLPRVRFHDLRHTAATTALRAGVPVRVVAEWLGHSNTAITENTYMHVAPSMMEEAGATVTSLILGSASG